MAFAEIYYGERLKAENMITIICVVFYKREGLVQPKKGATFKDSLKAIKIIFKIII